jgi:ribosomal protein S18 acetylase RimI-like enzyme
MNPDSKVWLERISAADVLATAATRTVVDTSAFKLLLDPVNDFAGMNWATPLKPAPSKSEMSELCEAFQAHNRTPRLEFIAETWQGLVATLEGAGFCSEGEPQDIMLVTRDTFKPFAAAGVNVQFLEADDSETLFQTYLETQTQGFGYSTDPPTGDQITAWHNQIRAGRRAALAFLEARAAGVGTMLGTELAELQGVTTIPEARRLGVAGSISSALVVEAFEAGVQAVWLSVEEDGARACYAKLGFQVIGARLNYSLNSA